MKKITLVLALATLIFTSCKEGANKSKGDGTFSFTKETIGSYIGDTLFVDGPAIIINPYAIDKDMAGKDINDVERELLSLKRDLDQKYKAEKYTVFIVKQNYIVFENAESGFGKITYYTFDRFNRMAVIQPGKGATSFATWEDLDGLEKVIHPKPEPSSEDTKMSKEEEKEVQPEEMEKEGTIKELK